VARAQLAVYAGDLTWRLPRVEDVEALGYHNDEMPTWFAEVSAMADLWRGRPLAAWAATERALAAVHGSSMAWRAAPMLANAARAATDMTELDPKVDRSGIEQTLRDHVEETGSFVAHPARVLCAASGVTFEAELARLRRVGDEAAWRAAKDTWAGYGVPHHAAYAGWRLAECLAASGRRKETEAELAVAHAGAEGHLPLRRAIEGFARRARLPVPTAAVSSSEDPASNATANRYGLTPRELSVLKLLGTGATNAEIGRRLYMSPKTASVHVTAILRKLGVSSRVQAATVAERMGLLDVE
jgi:DNA-binding CsgD family transcriptional regulator